MTSRRRQRGSRWAPSYGRGLHAKASVICELWVYSAAPARAMPPNLGTAPVSPTNHQRKLARQRGPATRHVLDFRDPRGYDQGSVGGLFAYLIGNTLVHIYIKLKPLERATIAFLGRSDRLIL